MIRLVWSTFVLILATSAWGQQLPSYSTAEGRIQAYAQALRQASEQIKATKSRSEKNRLKREYKAQLKSALIDVMAFDPMTMTRDPGEVFDMNVGDLRGSFMGPLRDILGVTATAITTGFVLEPAFGYVFGKAILITAPITVKFAFDRVKAFSKTVQLRTAEGQRIALVNVEQAEIALDLMQELRTQKAYIPWMRDGDWKEVRAEVHKKIMPSLCGGHFDKA